MPNKALPFLGIIALTGALGLSADPGAPTLKKVTEFDLPGPPGKRFDYLTIPTNVLHALIGVVHHSRCWLSISNCPF